MQFDTQPATQCNRHSVAPLKNRRLSLFTFYLTLTKTLAVLISLLLFGSLASAASAGITAKPIVKFETTKGDILVELNPEKAPQTVANFLTYVRSGFYTDTIFHRVIPQFMIQGGGFDSQLDQKSTNAAIKNEADNGLKNDIYTIAMARTNDPHSATAQFFINTHKNDFLNFKDKSLTGWGYTVFGKVIKGRQVVDQIATAVTTSKNGMSDVPVETIVIKKALIQ